MLGYCKLSSYDGACEFEAEDMDGRHSNVAVVSPSLVNRILHPLFY
jgi:hypothetical protein